VDYPKNDKVYERARTTEAVHANELWAYVDHKRVVLIWSRADRERERRPRPSVGFQSRT